MRNDFFKYLLIHGRKKSVESETLPMTFKAKRTGNLKNYRIYGNTVNGESVGDKTENLFDETNGVVTDTYIKNDGTTATGLSGDRFICNRINVLPNITYIFSWKKTVLGTDINTPYIRVAHYDSNGNFLSRILMSAYESPNNRYVVTAGNTVSLWDIRIDDASSTRGQHFEEVMLNLGSNALPYEPYGYRIPITNNAETANIYLDEPLRKGRIYGFHIDPSVSDSSNAVTYIADAVGKTPAAMGASTFSYGDWENAFFIPKPCMLKSDGTVDYYLNPNDYTKKADGTLSDVANTNYDGNAMMEWGKIWYKFVPTETDGEVSFYVADYKADNDFECWCNIDSQNNETDHFYTAIYNGTGTSKLRSISGVALTAENGSEGTTVTQEVERATANNTTNNVEWYTEVYSDRMLINMLLILMGKSLNSQAVYGRGLDTGGQTAKEAYVTGMLNDKGLFWGVTDNGNSAVKVFGMENYWGCVWHRIAGLISIDNHAYAKLTYSTADGSSTTGYNQTGNGYLDFGSVPNTNGWVKTMKYNHKGLISSVIGGTNVDSNHYYGDYYYQTAGTRYLLLGGDSSADGGVGPSYFALYSAPTGVYWGISAALSCKPMSKGSKIHTPDYIDYTTQKRHNSEGTENTVILPEIAVTTGTNTLTIGTEVQPSKVYLQGHISRGDNNAE